jgi:hypothetical protein
MASVYTLVSAIFMVVVTLALLPMAWATVRPALPYLLPPAVIISGALAGLIAALIIGASDLSAYVLGGAVIAGVALRSPARYRTWRATRARAAAEHRQGLERAMAGYAWQQQELLCKGHALFWDVIVGLWRGQSLENDRLWTLEQHQRPCGGFYTPLGGFTADDARFLGPEDFDAIEKQRLEEFRREWESWEAEASEREQQRTELARFETHRHAKV